MPRHEEGICYRRSSQFSAWDHGKGIAILSGPTMAGKILIVEDNSDLSDLLALYLRGMGYETSQARSSRQGIRKALAERPDLIITDLHLPDMNALEATRLLKQNPDTSGIPIIILTATSFGEWKEQAVKAGIAGYLTKPTSPPELAKVVRTLLTEF